MNDGVSVWSRFHQFMMDCMNWIARMKTDSQIKISLKCFCLFFTFFPFVLSEHGVAEMKCKHRADGPRRASSGPNFGWDWKGMQMYCRSLWRMTFDRILDFAFGQPIGVNLRYGGRGVTAREVMGVFHCWDRNYAVFPKKVAGNTEINGGTGGLRKHVLPQIPKVGKHFQRKKWHENIWVHLKA